MQVLESCTGILPCSRALRARQCCECSLPAAQHLLEDLPKPASGNPTRPQYSQIIPEQPIEKVEHINVLTTSMSRKLGPPRMLCTSWSIKLLAVTYLAWHRRDAARESNL